MENTCVVLIPIYKSSLTENEEFSVSESMKKLIDFDIKFIAPTSLDKKYYLEIFPSIEISSFDDSHFVSISEYNKLLLNPNFYKSFNEYDYILLLQTDAIILKPDLKKWLSREYDYIGAPWPSGYSIDIKSQKTGEEFPVKSTVFVGNGGLSLRNIKSTLNLFEEFPDVRAEWQERGHAEDLFFSFVGNISSQFKIPSIGIAAEFSFDIDPEIIYRINGGISPFGAHAWEKYNPEFWENLPEWPSKKGSNILKKPKILITAPPFTKSSAGIVVLHELCDDLSKLGYDAALILMSVTNAGIGFSLEKNNSFFNTELFVKKIENENELADYLNNGITIYPEIITGNPLHAKNVIRYFLNKEAVVFGNKVNPDKADFILSYSKQYHAEANAYLYKPLSNIKCNDLETLPALSRNLDVTYLGKGVSATQCHVIPNTMEITREFPKTQDELFLALRNTRYYFTWDPLSATNIDALKCGAIPVFLNFLPFTEKEIDELEQGAFPRASYKVKADGSYEVTVPNDYFEKRNSYLSGIKESFSDYKNNLRETFLKIEQHFGFQ